MRTAHDKVAETSDLDIADPWTLGWFKVNQTGLIVK
jgi:hypothetical protein